jgi:L-arabinonolactonase
VPEIYVITPALATLGENPIWDVEEERLYWIDVFEGSIFRSTPDGRDVRVSKVPGHISALALRAGGGAIVTLGPTIQLLDLETGECELIFDAESGPGKSFNDGKVDRQGRFVTGAVDSTLLESSAPDLVDSIEPLSKLYRVDGDLGVHVLSGGIGISNGPCFSPDGSTLFWGDSWARRIYAFDYDPATGQASQRRMVTTFEDSNAVPDGATVDEEGFVWVATFNGGEVRRYAPDGTLDRRLPMPVGLPTSVAFGGADLDVLFVTSMGSATLPGYVAPPGPLGGCVLAVRGLGVRGVPEVRFAG